MLRKAEEIQVQLREAVEDNIMLLIEHASRNRESSVFVPADEVPAWLRSKLSTYGYIVEAVKETEKLNYRIYWGDGVA